MSGLRQVNFQFTRFDLWKNPSRRPWLCQGGVPARRLEEAPWELRGKKWYLASVTAWDPLFLRAWRRTWKSQLFTRRLMTFHVCAQFYSFLLIPTLHNEKHSYSGMFRVQWPMMFTNITSNHCFWQLRICDRSCEFEISMAGRHSTFEVTRHLSGQCYGRAMEAFKRSFSVYCYRVWIEMPNSRCIKPCKIMGLSSTLTCFDRFQPSRIGCDSMWFCHFGCDSWPSWSIKNALACPCSKPWTLDWNEYSHAAAAVKHCWQHPVRMSLTLV